MPRKYCECFEQNEVVSGRGIYWCKNCYRDIDKERVEDTEDEEPLEGSSHAEIMINKQNRE